MEAYPRKRLRKTPRGGQQQTLALRSDGSLSGPSYHGAYRESVQNRYESGMRKAASAPIAGKGTPRVRDGAFGPSESVKPAKGQIYTFDNSISIARTV